MTAAYVPEHISQVVNGHLLCPLCDEKFALPEREEIPPALAEIFSMSPRGMADTRMIQKVRQLEHEIERHLKTHPVQEWLTALMQARDELAGLRAEAKS